MTLTKIVWSDENFRTFVESSPDAKVFVDVEGRIVLVNAQTEELFGYPRSELVGKPLQVLIPSRFHDRVPGPGEQGWEPLRPDLRRRAVAIYAQRSDGTEFPAEVSIGSLETDQGTIFATTIRDATDQVEARAQLLHHLSDLAHESRLSSMGEMVAGLAHELNQPLYAISNYARAFEQLARSHSGMARPVTELAEKLTGQAERAAEIVRRLRRFVTRREPRRAAVDVNALVREVQQLLLFHANRFSISTQLKLADGLPGIYGDALLIEQVLLNLVRNAYEAMSEPSNGQSTVTVETGLVDDRMIAVTVTDNGPGFGDVTPDQLFEAFFTTKEQGMGLGLVISRSIVEAHGGRLTAQPNPTGGAVFRLTLPAHTDSLDAKIP